MIPEAIPFTMRSLPAAGTVFSCGLCGLRFTHSGLVCGTCPMQTGCALVRCPNCGFQFPRSSGLVDFVRRMLGRVRRNR